MDPSSSGPSSTRYIPKSLDGPYSKTSIFSYYYNDHKKQHRYLLLWSIIILGIVLNLAVAVLYLLDAIGVGFLQPFILTIFSGVLSVLFGVLWGISFYMFKTVRMLENSLHPFTVTSVYFAINLATFIAFLVWIIAHNEGEFTEPDFDANPEAYTQYVGINVVALTLVIGALLVTFISVEIDYIFRRNVEILKLTTSYMSGKDLYEILYEKSQTSSFIKSKPGNLSY